MTNGNRQSRNRLVLFRPTGQRSGASPIVSAARCSSSTKSKAALGLRFWYHATALLTSAIAPWWYSTRLALIHHGQELAMQLLPRDSHSFARFQVSDSASDFVIPSLLHRLIRDFKTVQQGMGQCSALVNRECERPSQQIGNFWTHGFILPRVPVVLVASKLKIRLISVLHDTLRHIIKALGKNGSGSMKLTHHRINRGLKQLIATRLSSLLCSDRRGSARRRLHRPPRPGRDDRECG